MALRGIPSALTRREREVAALVAEGLTNRDIAQRLFISERTADGHLEHIREKLGFTSRAQIATWVARQPEGSVIAGGEKLAGNLPDSRTSFIGREREMVEMRRALGEARLLTLSGAGGCGKTRLAIEAARQVQNDFPDGVWLAELAPVADDALVASSVAASLGVREEPGRSFVDLVADFLSQKRLLLVLDNCEHVLAGTADLSDQVLRRCPDVRLLATSRQDLAVEGERNLPVLSLGLPSANADAAAVAQSEAGKLFLDRARAVSPNVAIDAANADAISSICGRLDGMPLAIELAAARVGFLTPQEIDDRLDGRLSLHTSGARSVLPRHRTLRALIDWSHDLLSEHEAILYRRLGVFVGGFTLEAAEHVCSGAPPDAGKRLRHVGTAGSEVAGRGP